MYQTRSENHSNVTFFNMTRSNKSCRDGARTTYGRLHRQDLFLLKILLEEVKPNVPQILFRIFTPDCR